MHRLLIALVLLLLAPASSRAINISVNPSEMHGGGFALASITNAPSGTTLYLWSSSGAVMPPSSVTLPPFQTSTNAFLTTSPTSFDTVATVFVGFSPGVAAASDTITIRAPRIATLLASPDIVAGGDPATVTLSLSSPAPANYTIPLSTSTDAFGPVPAHVTFPAFATQASFTIPTIGVESTASIVLSATWLDSSASERITLTPAQLDHAELLTTDLTPGSQARLRIHMRGEPVHCGRPLIANAITTARGGQVIIPPGVLVPPGETTVDIPVNIPDLTECQQVTVTITDPSDGRQTSETLTIRGLNDETEFNLPFVCNASTSAGVVIADFDGDGDLDVLSAIGGDAFNNPGVEVFPNDGIGRLPEDAAWDYTDRDFDNVIDIAAANLIATDTLPDPVLLDRDNASIVVLKNAQDGFSPAYSATTRGRPLALALGDIDNDSDLDFVVTSETLDSIEVIRNNGVGAASTGWVSSGHLPVDVVTGRFNNDAFADAATACLGSGGVGRVAIHLGTSAATLSAPTFIDLDAPALALAAGDFDEDGDDDIAVATTAAEIIILLNNGGVFSETERHALVGPATAIRTGDLEDDGDLDLAFACDGLEEGGVLLNAGCALFDPADPILLPVDSGPALALGDLNGDRRLDIVLTRPQEDEILELLQLGEPCATYIVMSIHGQDGSGFNPLWNENAPTQPHGWPNAASNPATPQGPMFPLLERFVDEINYIRTERAGLCPIRLMTHEFDWVNMTGRGQRLILASRVSFMLTFLSPIDTPLLLAGFAAETVGRLQTATATREAAGQVILQLDEMIEQARYLDPEAPIFIDIICHSRGTTVTSEVLRRLVAREQLPLGDNVSLSVSYISVIEPLFPFGIVRPGASAGDLMGDPAVDRHATATRIAHFYENRACVTSGGVCIGTSFFDVGFINFLLGLGLDWPVDFLVEYAGYPKSIGDNTLNPDVEGLVASDHNAIIAQFSHIEPITVGLPSTIPVGPSGPGVPAPPQFNFAWTSYFGDMMRTPTQEIPEATRWPGSPVREAPIARGGPLELIHDPTFAETGELVRTVDQLFASPDHASLFVGDIALVGAELEAICALGWPTSGAWRPSRPDVFAGGAAGDENATFTRACRLEQTLDPASLDRDEIEVWIEFELLSPDASLAASLSGVGLERCDLWDASDTPLNTRVIRAVGGPRHPLYPATFGAWRSDELGLYANDTIIYEVTTIPPVTPVCEGDANGDNLVNFTDLEILLEAWNTTVTPGADGDVNNDGEVNFTDLEILLEAWGTACEP